MLFIGDVHGKFNEYDTVMKRGRDTFQVGDFGIGFPGYKPRSWPMNHKFIRGNHDNPELCRKHPNYMGNFGYRGGLFFMGGANSIDKIYRTEGKDWWPDEQLSVEQLSDAIEQYERLKPSVLVTHMTGLEVQQHLFDFSQVHTSRTLKALDIMWKNHQPKLWVFGHYHKSVDTFYRGCRIICLNELDTIEIPLDQYGVKI